MIAPLPANEAQRLRILQMYRIVDTAAEKAFDDLTHLAAEICNAPISLLSLVDSSRQWFKSSVGLDAKQTPRDLAFCAHAILGDDDFVVNDARKDERFAANPLVTAAPSIRFYAGIPLTVMPGVRLGTLCVIDRKPRTLSATQLKSLRTLRNVVITHLELRRALLDLTDLQRLVPMCAWCRKVRTSDGKWLALHDYVAQTTLVSHGMCPSCAEVLPTA